MASAFVAESNGPLAASGAEAVSGLAGDGMPIVRHDTIVQSLVNGVDRDRLLDELRRLTGEAPLCVQSDCQTNAKRITGSAELAHAVDYVADTAQTLGYNVSVEPWRSGPYTDRNVILRKTGTISPTEEVYYVAHVDGVNCPAADDNGSGTVAALEMARLFADVEFARTVVIFFSTGEEQLMHGVKAFLKSRSQAEIAAIHSLINSDMIGYDGDGDRVMELYHDNHPPSMAVARVMADVVPAYKIDLVIQPNAGCG